MVFADCKLFSFAVSDMFGLAAVKIRLPEKEIPHSFLPSDLVAAIHRIISLFRLDHSGFTTLEGCEAPKHLFASLALPR